MIRSAAAALLLLIAGACDGGVTPQPGQPADGGYAAKVKAMPAGQRDAVLIRAIRDARQDCQHVTSSAPAGEGAWDARCDDGRVWRIAIGEDGAAQVTPSAASSTPAMSDASAQGAAQVLESYFAALGRKDHPSAWRLWADGGKASGQDEPSFAASFASLATIRAEIGDPGEAEDTAGSRFIEVPFSISGRTVSGRTFADNGTAVLRRASDEAGAPAEQQWRIYNMSVAPPAE